MSTWSQYEQAAAAYDEQLTELTETYMGRGYTLPDAHLKALSDMGPEPEFPRGQ